MRYVKRGEADPAVWRELAGGEIGPVLAQLLTQRGVATLEEAQAFLHPDASMLHDPYLLSGMEQAVKRIRRAIQAGERITVYGDYDADGVTATSVLIGYFSSIGVKADYYIPSRHEEGYGLNDAAVRALAQTTDLLITVDCGITAHEETLLAKSLGMDVVITDHHQLQNGVPEAVAVIDPLIGDYPCPHLCGAGVALKLVQALGGVEAALALIDLAALGTVADIVPLNGENRVIAALGLAAMNRELRLGLRVLCETAGLKDRAIEAGHLGYALGPRINAGGRIDRSSKSVDMLLSQDEAFARQVAGQLDAHNKERQRQEQAIMAQCEEMIPSQIDFVNDRAVVLCGEGWNHGVVGIVASRLTERFGMPCLLLARDGDTLTGSGRSVRGVHILKALTPCAQLLSRFGGHEMAAGLTLPAENFQAFKALLNQTLLGTVDDAVFEPSAAYDLVLSPGQVTGRLCEEVALLAPCGMGNPNPLFLMQDVSCQQVRLIGNAKQHVRAQLAGSPPLGAVGFHMAPQQDVFHAKVDLLCEVSLNEWNGVSTPQALLRTVQPAQNGVLEALKSSQEELARDFLRGLMHPERSGGQPCAKVENVRKTWYNEDGGVDSPPVCAPERKRGALWLFTDAAHALSQPQDLPLRIGAPEDDKRAFASAVAYPVVDATFANYRTFYLMDGHDPALVRALTAVAPDAQVYCAREEAPSVYCYAYLPVERMRECYGYVRRKANQLHIQKNALEAAQKASEALGITRLQFYAALMVFNELAFLQVDFEKWSLRLSAQPQKTELTNSPLYAYLCAHGGRK